MSTATRDVRTWWQVEVATGGWHMVGIHWDNLTDAGDFADQMRLRYPGTAYRVVRIDRIREIEERG